MDNIYLNIFKPDFLILLFLSGYFVKFKSDGTGLEQVDQLRVEIF